VTGQANENGASIARTASAEEAAAIVAAIERFLRDTAPASASAQSEPEDRWRRAALLEGVRRQPELSLAEPWING
jgi:hypothetical protein